MSGTRHFIAEILPRVVRLPLPSQFARRRLIAATMALAGLILLPVAAQSAVKTIQGEADISRPHVYLMRGLLNIFSLGMDQLAVQIARHGVEAGVYNHTLADAVVNEIVQKYRAGDHGPYILVGHSLGADAVMMMAQSLNSKGVPVALVVPFDGTGSYAAPQNVACVLNLTQRQYAYMRPGMGLHGRLSKGDGSSDASIDKSPRLQAVALSSVLQAAHAQACRPGVSGPTVARPKEAPAPNVAAPKEAPAKEVPARSASPGMRPGFEG